MTDNIVELGSIRKELKESLKKETILAQAVKSFVETSDNADGFISIIFTKDDAIGLKSNILWGGKIDLVKTIGCLQITSTELSALVLEFAQEGMGYEDA